MFTRQIDWPSKQEGKARNKPNRVILTDIKMGGYAVRDKPISGKADASYSIKYNTEAHTDYIKYFKENNDDVIFLNGKWGSGKTSYLNVVLEENAKKFLFFEFNKKVIKTIDLWRITTNQKTSEIFYRSLFPVTGFIARYVFFLIFLLFSGLAVYFSNLEFANDSSASNTATYFFFISGFLSGITQVLGNIDYDTLFLNLLKIRSKNPFLLRKRIIIIDDFDRIEAYRQEELYKIFNLVTSKKVKFVFLGDYNIIQKNEGSYLQKIIDRRIELPYNLSPSNFWTAYFEDTIADIEEKRGISLSNTEKNNLDSLKKEIITENRTLREKNMFEKYVKEILFFEQRYDKVNIDQQFLTIYLYLFHINFYNTLVNKIDDLLEPHNSLGFILAIRDNAKRKKEELEKLTIEATNFFDTQATPSRTTILILDILLCYNNLYGESPYQNYKYAEFITQFPNYLINYVPLNIEGKYIRDLVSKPYTREEVLEKLKKDFNSDIFNYIRRNQQQFTASEKENLFNLAMELVVNLDDKYPYDESLENHTLRKQASLIISIALSVNTHFDVRERESAQAFLQESFIYKLDVSAQLRFYQYYLHIDPRNVLSCQKEEINNILQSGELNKLSYPEFILHHLFLQNRCLSEQYLDLLLALTDRHFYYFSTRYTVNTQGIQKLPLNQIVQDDQLDKVVTRYNSMTNSYYKEKLKAQLEEEV